MIKTDFSTPVPDRLESVHFIGIGGAGMSGIATLFLGQGIAVSGSDARESDNVVALRERGARVMIGHAEEHLGDVDAVVVSGAISEDNPEFLRARRLGIPTVHRAVALAWLTREARLVAVAGAHGKTTSTAMLVTALSRLGLDPSFVNGGVIRELGVSAAAGSSELFVVEADESDGSFLLYDTAVALITNIDPDHLDHYGTRDAFVDAFVSFAARARELVVLSSDDQHTALLLERLADRRTITFGLSAEADVRVHAVDSGESVSFVVAWAGEEFPVRLRVAGVHNAVNAAGAFAVLVGIGVDPRDAVTALEAFGGAERRFEFRGEVSGVRVFDDFAHHPTEVAAALSGARGVAGEGRVVVLFQPHLFTRTRDMAQEFADTLERLADHTVVIPIYPAREEPIPGVTAESISSRFSDRALVEFEADWDAAAERAAVAARPGDIIVTMGGGDVHLVVPSVLGALERRGADAAS